jgi:2-polyprenyl-6-methoxyphenol hydroxylase-like FAD-dependent oxidoreductase
VLVVGDTLGALATAGFLEQSGLDPVLTTARPDRTRSPVVSLWKPGLELLERLGLRRPVERLGTPLDRLHCVSSSSTWVDDETNRPSLVAISRGALDQLFEDRLLTRVRTIDKPITNVTSTEVGVRVTFGHGIEEPFDILVSAGQRFARDAGYNEWGPTFDSWILEWPPETPVPDGSVEVWGEDCALFSVPVADTGFVRLVAPTETDSTAAVTSEDLDARFGTLFKPPNVPQLDLTQRNLQYSRTPRLIPASVFDDRNVVVGQPVSGSLPGDCLGPALSVEDAWVLADSLSYGPSSIDDALATYERRRRQRLTDILDRFDSVAADTDRCEVVSAGLYPLCAARSIAFGHLLEPDGRKLTEDIPNQL